MPIPEARVKDICFVHIHSSDPATSDPAFPRKVLSTLLRQAVPQTAKVICTRGTPVNQQFFAASLKKAGDERQTNFLDKAQFSLHLEEFTDGQGGRGQVCLAISKAAAGPHAVKCVCGRMVNTGPKARCPYCGRALVGGAAPGRDEAPVALLDEAAEAASPPVPEAFPGIKQDLGLRMSSRARAGGGEGGGFVRENLKLILGAAALAAVGFVWFVFLRGKTLNSEWKTAFQGCKWEICIPQLEKAAQSGALADKEEMSLRLAQARLEKGAQAVSDPPQYGPTLAVVQSRLLSSGLETLFVQATIENSTANDADVDPSDFYLLMQPPTRQFELVLAEPIEEAPFTRTTVPPKQRLTVAMKMPTPAKSIEYMWLVYNTGTHYRRTIVTQNFPIVKDKSFLGAEWKPKGPEKVEAPPPPATPPTPTNTPPTATPSTPSSDPTPPSAVQPPPKKKPSIEPGPAELEAHGWHIERGSAFLWPVIFDTVLADEGTRFLVQDFKLHPHADEAKQWPIASSDFRLVDAAGKTYIACGALTAVPGEGDPRSTFAEWAQMSCGARKAEKAVVLDRGRGLITARRVETVSLNGMGEMWVVFAVDANLPADQTRVDLALGDAPSAAPTAPGGAFLLSHWSTRGAGCAADAVPLGNCRDQKTKLATEDWVLEVADLGFTQGFDDKKKLGERSWVVQVALDITPWHFRSAKGAPAPLDTKSFGLRTPKGEESRPIKWIVKDGGRDVQVDSVVVLGSEKDRDGRLEVKGKTATFHVGPGGVAHVWVALEGIKDEGDLSTYLLIHGLKLP